jgi:hypothetical protein
MCHMAELCPLRSNPQRAHEEIEIPKYSEHVSRTLSPTFQIHSSPSFESWVHMIWMRKDIQARHVEVYVQNAGRPIIWMCRDPTIWVMGDPHLEDQLISFQGGTNPHPHYKYPQTFRYGLAKIIAIKPIPLIHILLRIDLSIGVGSADTSSKHLYWPYYFAGKDKKNFPEACATELKTVLINVFLHEQLCYFSHSFHISWCCVF